MNGTDYEKLFLYEQQSSKNGNMPLRCLFYVSDNYSRMVRFGEKSRTMREYMIFVDKVRRYSENQPLEAAIEQTVDECIQEDVLRDFLLTHKAEVKKNSGKYEKNRCSKTEQRYHHPFNQKRLSSFYFTGFQAGSTYVHFLSRTVGGLNAEQI